MMVVSLDAGRVLDMAQRTIGELTGKVVGALVIESKLLLREVAHHRFIGSCQVRKDTLHPYQRLHLVKRLSEML